MAAARKRNSKAYDAARYARLKNDTTFKAGRSAYAKQRLAANPIELTQRNVEAQRRWRKRHAKEHLRRKRARYKKLRSRQDRQPIEQVTSIARFSAASASDRFVCSAPPATGAND